MLDMMPEEEIYKSEHVHGFLDKDVKRQIADRIDELDLDGLVELADVIERQNKADATDAGAPRVSAISVEESEEYQEMAFKIYQFEVNAARKGGAGQSPL